MKWFMHSSLSETSPGYSNPNDDDYLHLLYMVQRYNRLTCSSNYCEVLGKDKMNQMLSVVSTLHLNLALVQNWNLNPFIQRMKTCNAKQRS